jgi:spore coat polysaccharide biosynthesis protein SpsF (cytidylyltransferase family)
VHETARLTLDYPEDLTFFEALFGELYKERTVFGIDAIVSLLHTASSAGTGGDKLLGE